MTGHHFMRKKKRRELTNLYFFDNNFSDTEVIVKTCFLKGNRKIVKEKIRKDTALTNWQSVYRKDQCNKIFREKPAQNC